VLEALHVVAPALIALVGAGGKTTTMHRLVDEARRRGWRAVAGTTTRVGIDHVRAGEEFIHAGRRGDKYVGVSPDHIERRFATRSDDLIVVEADGARGKVVKAPGPHEPVLPTSTTLLVAVIGADALDRVIEDVAHRPMRVAAVCGCRPYERLTVARAVTLLTSPRGSMKAMPATARFAVAITRVGPAQVRLAADLEQTLAARGVSAIILDPPAGSSGRH
jgi:probable selenium-dependent hydroxylase accessory protein YqeC